MATARQQVIDPSLHAIVFQTRSLLDRLEALSDSEYPPEAIRIRNLFVVLADQVQRRLWSIHERRSRNHKSSIDQPLGNADAEHVIQLSKVVQTIHSCLRYLQSSRFPSTPPEIQTAISTLIQQHVCPALNCKPDEVVVLVRPQWTYNLKYVNLLSHLEREIEFAVLDPQGEFSTESFQKFVAELWAKQRPESACQPKHVAVISFAGLDGHDALLYPLLAHEIAHLIDFGFAGTLRNNPRLRAEEHLVTGEETETIFNSFYSPNPPSVALEPYRTGEVTRQRKRVNEHIHVCLGEITSDLLAARMLGLPYFIAMAEYLKDSFKWPQESIDSTSGYPGMAYRLQLVYQEITDNETGLDTVGRLEQLLASATLPNVKPAIQRGLDYLKEWGSRFAGLQPSSVGFTTLEARLAYVVQERVERMLPELRNLIREVIPGGRLPRTGDRLEDFITLLQERVPPAQPLLSKETLEIALPETSFTDVFTAGWLYELAFGDEQGEQSTLPKDAHAQYQNTCQLLFKAIELQGARPAIVALEPDAFKPIPARPQSASKGIGGAASGPMLVEALCQKELADRLFVVPYYGLRPINAATMDIRLGNWFRIARRTRSTSINLTDKNALQRVRREEQSEVYVPFGHEFTLHPGDFALAISLEYIAFPPNLLTFVEGKSGLGRAGLIVATATQVAPGFKGGIVLELFNSGTVPLILKPGMQIAQLVFFTTDRPLPAPWLYSGKFHCQIKP